MLLPVQISEPFLAGLFKQTEAFPETLLTINLEKQTQTTRLETTGIMNKAYPQRGMWAHPLAKAREIHR